MQYGFQSLDNHSTIKFIGREEFMREEEKGEKNLWGEEATLAHFLYFDSITSSITKENINYTIR